MALPKLKELCVFILLITIFSCGFNQEKHIVGNYYLIAIDTKDQMSLSYKLPDDGGSVGIVGETVFAIGYNQNYIIVKQHRYSIPNVRKNKNITTYFIVPIYDQNTLQPEKGILGPLTLSAFEQKRKELNISDIKFTIVFEDLE